MRRAVAAMHAAGLDDATDEYCRCGLGQHDPASAGRRQGVHPKEKLTRKRLLDVDHVPGAGLHEAAAALARPLQPGGGADLALAGGEVALVAGDDAHGGHAAAGEAGGRFGVDERGEVVEGGERARAGDVVDEQEGVRVARRRAGRYVAVFFLPGCVGEVQEVGLAVDGARYRVGVFCGGLGRAR